MSKSSGRDRGQGQKKKAPVELSSVRLIIQETLEAERNFRDHDEGEEVKTSRKERQNSFSMEELGASLEDPNAPDQLHL